MRFYIKFLALAMILLGPLAQADEVVDGEQHGFAGADCPLPLEEKLLATEYGSAGFIKNMAESPDSIRAIAARLLEVALAGENEPAAGCEPACPHGQTTQVIYRVAPVSFLADNKQHEVCLAFENQTAANPMLFEARSFSSVDDVNEWMTAFSQGRGEDGRLLYERCSSNCSPRYTFVIHEQDAGYEVKAEVLCGLARDKSNDQYLISTAVRHRCAVN